MIAVDAVMQRQSWNVCFMAETWYRHQLLYGEKAEIGSLELLGTPLPPPEIEQEVQDWLKSGKPMVVSRPCFSNGGIWCGIPLYSPDGVRRIRLHVSPSFIRRRMDMPLLDELGGRFPLLDNQSIRSLVQAGASCGVPIHCFGSHAWTYLTGYNYTHPQSDLDLLAEIPDAATWVAFRQKLEICPLAESPIRIDLEIRLQKNLSFSWSEFQNPRDSMVVKTNEGCRLINKDTLLFSP